MSLLQPTMIINSFSPGHMRSRSHNELLKSLVQSNLKKRAFEDDIITNNKRSRTAPPSPPSPPHESSPFTLHPISPDTTPPSRRKFSKYSKSLRSRSLSPRKTFFNPLSPSNSPKSSPVSSPPSSVEKKQQYRVHNIKLPLITHALSSAPLTTEPVKLKPIAPTVSLDYFDTYKPNDENWRYELLDSINKGSKHFNLNQYNYLNKHLSPSSSPSTAYTQPPFYKPNFDSRISSRITKPTLIPSINQSYEKKINFPYESNYTYLNKTYMTDVERYPEYLELAQSLIQLSRPQQMREDFESPKQSPAQVSSPPQINTPPTNQRSPVQRSSRSPQRSSRSPEQQSPYSPLAASAEIERSPVQTTLAPPSTVYASAQTNNFYSPPPKYTYESPYQHSPAAAAVTESIQLAPLKLAPMNALLAPLLQPMSHNTYMPLQKLQSPDMRAVHASHVAPAVVASSATAAHRFIPITPPKKSKSDVKSPSKNSSHGHHHNHNPRICISCGSDQSPCWRPSWSIKEGQLCNSCGLRYKKTSARCLNSNCKKIPAKGDWSLMQSKGKLTFEDGVEGYSCLECAWRVEVKKP